MTTPAVRGSWNVDDAIFAKWSASGLDTAFKNAWPAGVRTSNEFFTLNSDEAMPTRGNDAHPRPYAIFEKSEGRVLGHSSGAQPNSADTVQQYQDIPFQFVIFANTKAGAKQWAKAVAQVFDRANLNLQDDALINIFRDPDFHVRHDDSTWAWVLQYRARIDAAYLGSLT